MKYLVTGCAGFIGFHLTLKLLKNKNFKVLGIDNINNYYSIKIKNDRLKILKKYKNFVFKKISIENKKKLNIELNKFKPKKIYHLAAQAGVRYSFINPLLYYKSNLEGFFNVLDYCRKAKIEHLIFASTSSVYGNNNKFPLKESYETNPISFYASSKVCNEILAKDYSINFNIKITGVRFFTVYGPFGRPDMFIYKLFMSLKNNSFINIFNKGNHFRDFTFIDDAIKILTLLEKRKSNKYDVFNICNGKSIHLSKVIFLCQKYAKKKINFKFLKLQKGDVKKTHGSFEKTKSVIKVIQKTSIEKGIKKFHEWFNLYYTK
jgi:UDP-glucuronate 4-epimerase